MAENRLPFRPLDNSSTTRLSYGLEANHWIKALNSAQASTSSTLSVIPIIGALLTIFMCLLFMIMIGILTLLEWALSGIKEKENTSTPSPTANPSVPIMEDGDEDFYKSWH